MVKSEPKKKPQSGGFFQRFFRKSEKSQKEQRLTVQRSIPYLEMGRDGICRVEEICQSGEKRWGGSEIQPPEIHRGRGRHCRKCSRTVAEKETAPATADCRRR